MSRNPKSPLTDTQRRDICQMLASGASRASAVQFAGCHIAALRAEMRRNPDFARHVLQAELNLESAMLRAIRTAAESGEKQWRAAAWALERIYPNRYAKRRSDTLTVEQVHEFISEVTEIVASELPVPRFRQRIFNRLAILLATAHTRSPLNAASENDHVPADSAEPQPRIAGPAHDADSHGQSPPLATTPASPDLPTSHPAQTTS